MTAHLHTVTGPVDAALLERCYAHAHLLGGPVERPLDGSAATADLHLVDPDASRSELETFRAFGGRAIVEMSCLDFNRSLAELKQLSLDTGIAIIAATGYRRGTTAQAAGFSGDWREVAERLEAEIRDGEHGITCGVVKAGSGLDELSDDDHVLLRAAAAAQTRTGAAISTHTEQGQLAVEQLDALERAGADPSRVAIGHLDREFDYEVHRAVLARGAYLIYDQIGKVKYRSLDDYAELLQRVSADGYANKVMLSADYGRRSYFRSLGGTPGLGYVLGPFVDEMRARGVPEEVLDWGTGANPVSFFACKRVGCQASAIAVPA